MELIMYECGRCIIQSSELILLILYRHARVSHTSSLVYTMNEREKKTERICILKKVVLFDSQIILQNVGHMA